MDRIQTVCEAALQVAFSGLFPFLHFLAFPHVVLGAAGQAVVAGMHILYEMHRRSHAMSHELGINAAQLFTKSLSFSRSINSLNIIY